MDGQIHRPTDTQTHRDAYGAWAKNGNSQFFTIFDIKNWEFPFFKTIFRISIFLRSKFEPGNSQIFNLKYVCLLGVPLITGIAQLCKTIYNTEVYNYPVVTTGKWGKILGKDVGNVFILPTREWEAGYGPECKMFCSCRFTNPIKGQNSSAHRLVSLAFLLLRRSCGKLTN